MATWWNRNTHRVALEGLRVEGGGPYLNGLTTVVVQFEDRDGAAIGTPVPLEYVPASNGNYEALVAGIDFGQQRIYAHYSGSTPEDEEFDLLEPVITRDRIDA